MLTTSFNVKKAERPAGQGWFIKGKTKKRQLVIFFLPLKLKPHIVKKLSNVPVRLLVIKSPGLKIKKGMIELPR